MRIKHRDGIALQPPLLVIAPFDGHQDLHLLDPHRSTFGMYVRVHGRGTGMPYVRSDDMYRRQLLIRSKTNRYV